MPCLSDELVKVLAIAAVTRWYLSEDAQVVMLFRAEISNFSKLSEKNGATLISMLYASKSVGSWRAGYCESLA